jgi:tetratricopeptide (TPR) repeat protein
MTWHRFLVYCLASAACHGALAQPGPSEPGPAAPAPPPSVTDSLRTETEAAVLDAVVAGEFERAITILQGARGRGLPLAIYHLLCAKVYAAKRDEVQEEEQLRGAIQRDPKLTEAYLRLAAIMERRGLWLEAVEQYHQAIDADRTCILAYLDLARLLADNERVRSALQVLEEARAAAPQDLRVLMALGNAYEKLGDRERAIADLKRALALATGETRVACLLKVADLSFELGDLAQSFLSYREATGDGMEATPSQYGRIAVVADEVGFGAFRSAWDAFESHVGG